MTAEPDPLSPAIGSLEAFPAAGLAPELGCRWLIGDRVEIRDPRESWRVLFSCRTGFVVNRLEARSSNETLLAVRLDNGGFWFGTPDKLGPPRHPFEGHER